MAATLEIFGSAIIVLGNFNPAIFTPEWLERHKLIGVEDAEKARQGQLVISAQASRFETEWFILQVLGDQFALTSNGALTPGIKDLAIGALSLLPHTPVRALGMNFFAHYKMATIADYHEVGDFLAPKEIWHKMFPGDNVSAGMTDVSITIEPVKRGEKPKTPDRKNLTVQPSRKVASGIFFSYNDHHEIADDDPQQKPSVEWCIKLINDQWQLIWEDSKRVFDGIIENAIKT